MTTQFFKAKEDVSDNWATYIVNEASAISKFDDFEIDNFADRELLNPDMQAFLNDLPDSENTLLKDDIYPLTLSFAESRASANSLFGAKFRRLKNKIREILCKVLSDLAGDSEINWKDIIKLVLVALIPALGGGPLSLIILPLLISLVAKLIKRGFEAVCPVAG